MARTQLRLDAVTGSLVAIEAAAAAPAVPAAGAAEHLEDVLGHFAGAIKRITGAPSFTEQAAGQFSQALTGSAGMQLAGDLDVNSDADFQGKVNLQAELVVAGKADFAGIVDVATTLSASEIKIDGDVPGRMYIVGGAGELKDTDKLAFDGTKFNVTGGGDFSGTLEAAAMKIDGDTPQRLYIVDADGSIKDEAKLIFDGAKLAIDANLEAADASLSGNLTVAGNLLVQGDTVTVNVGEMLVEDKDIVVAKNGTDAATLDGAGIKVGDAGAYASIEWSETNSKWSISEQVYSPVLQSAVASALFLKSDADGDIVAGSGADLGAAVMAQLIEGTGVHISELGGDITIAIGQAVETTSEVTFAHVTGSNLTASRLMASDANKVMVSADLSAWVAGTANQVIVADDSDGSITLSAPQDIHAAASPEFAGLKLSGLTDNYLVKSTAGVLENVALSALVAGTADEIQVNDEGNGTITLELGLKLLDTAGGYEGFNDIGPGNWGSVSEALDALYNTAAASSKKATHKVGASGFAADADMAASLSSNFIAELNAANSMVFVNGQLMLSGDDYAMDAGAGSLAFTFALVEDDVVVVQKA